MKQPPIVEIPRPDELYERCWYNGESYLARDLHMLAEACEVFDMPLAGIDINRNPWSGSFSNLNDFLFHYKRVEECNLRFPIILSPEGNILDGNHRICKAILEEKRTIKAVRLNYMPSTIKQQSK